MLRAAQYFRVGGAERGVDHPMNTRLSVVLLGLGALALAGCLSPLQQGADALVCNSARIRIDRLPPAPPPVEELPKPQPKEPAKVDAAAPGLQQVGALFAQRPEPAGDVEKDKQLRAKLAQMFVDRLKVPEGVPGSQAPPIAVKGLRNLPPAEQDKILARYFPPVLPMGPDPQPVPGPDGRPLTLEDLQRLARENSPPLRQAAFAIQAAQGAAWEAGMYPNPVLSLTQTQVSFTSGPTMAPGISQVIKTMGKLNLSQNMALMDLANAELAYRRAETDLMAAVRSAYYSVLLAEVSFKANHALVDLTDEVYKVMQQQLKAGVVATYEPMQLAVFAGQARQALIASRNNYLFAWKQLGAALGLPAMPATELAGSLDQRLPRFEYEKCLAQVLARHTDTMTARNGILKMRYNLRLNEVTPVPDVILGAAVLYDGSSPGPPRWMAVTTGSVTLPIWDRNHGGIKQAQAQLAGAVEEPHRIRAVLTSSVSDAFNRLDTSRIQLEMFVKQMLPHQVNAFRSAVLRHAFQDPALPGALALNDLIAAEQNLVSLIPMYLTTLGLYWQAVSDIASLLQTDNVYEMATELENCPLPDLAQLLKVPCCHPCSSLPDPALKGISPFESPPGRAVSPEIIGVEQSPSAPKAPDTPKGPEASKKASPASMPPASPMLPANPTLQPAPALLLPPITNAAPDPQAARRS
jgi:outer membrane protein, heavy metal efflux system